VLENLKEQSDNIRLEADPALVALRLHWKLCLHSNGEILVKEAKAVWVYAPIGQLDACKLQAFRKQGRGGTQDPSALQAGAAPR
jgi:hypothetical protein